MENSNFSLVTVDQSKKGVALTPIDIRNKDFRKVFRGYSCHEVEKFVDAVSKEYELLYAENFELREKLGKNEAELNQYKQLDNTLKQTMVLAQQTAEEVKHSAHQAAELLLKEAEQERGRRMSETQLKLDEINAEIEDLVRKRELIRTQLKSFLNAHLDLTAMYDKDAIRS